ncbi:MAG TPA: TRAP transporter TatT component family protein [Vicinamibacterales bacterium]|nr:TRAP transporter TatT component family protein [Vicinamibacterales bacterium]
MSLTAQTRTIADPDELYRQREDLSSAARAADLWAQRSDVDFEAAWKLSRACYWLGTHQTDQNARNALERGVNAGERAIRLGSDRSEGHFWLAANMGRLAESFGLIKAMKYRGRIKDELERVLMIDPAWQGGSADAALGQWYATVPRLFGGSRQRAEQHLRRALDRDANSTSALSFLGEMLASEGRTDEARDLLRRVVNAPFDAEWAPEDRELKQRSATLLKKIGG